MMGKKKCLVKIGGEGKYVVDVDKKIDPEAEDLLYAGLLNIDEVDDIGKAWNVVARKVGVSTQVPFRA